MILANIDNIKRSIGKKLIFCLFIKNKIKENINYIKLKNYKQISLIGMKP